MTIGVGKVFRAYDKKTGKADPYIRIGKVLTPFWDYKSAVRNETLDPEWCETGTFDVRRTNNEKICLAVEMLDKDYKLFDLDDKIGRWEVEFPFNVSGSFQNVEFRRDGVVEATLDRLDFAGVMVDRKEVVTYSESSSVSYGNGRRRYHNHHHHSFDYSSSDSD